MSTIPCGEETRRAVGSKTSGFLADLLSHARFFLQEADVCGNVLIGELLLSTVFVHHGYLGVYRAEGGKGVHKNIIAADGDERRGGKGVIGNQACDPRPLS
jgi:hypothetical protein